MSTADRSRIGSTATPHAFVRVAGILAPDAKRDSVLHTCFTCYRTNTENAFLPGFAGILLSYRLYAFYSLCLKRNVELSTQRV